MDKAVVLGALEYLVSLLLGDQTVSAGLGEVDGVVVEVDAHILLKMAAALAHQSAGPAAGAGANGNGGGAFDKGGDLVVGGGLGVVLYGLLHGDNTHEGHTRRGVGHQNGQSSAGVFLKAVAQIRISVALLPVGEDALHDAGYPDGIVVAGDAVHIVDADDAGLDKLIQLRLGEIDVLAGSAGDILHRAVCVETHVHHDLAHIVIHNGLQNAILGIAVSNAGVGEALQTDLGGQLQNIGSVCHAVPSFRYI